MRGSIQQLMLLLVALLLILMFARLLRPTGMWAGSKNVESSGVVGPLNASVFVKRLGVGINVDWLSFKRVHYWYFYWRSKGINVPMLFAQRGFSTVRVRIGGDVSSNVSLLEELKEVVDDCVRAGLNVVIAYSAPELRLHPLDPAAQQHFVEWWLAVAKFLRREPYTVAYDLIVETSGPIKSHPEVLNQVYARVIREIRAVDPYRIIIVTPAYVSSPFALDYLNVSNDGYVVAEWHIYAGGPCKRGKVGFNETLIREAVRAASLWSKRTGIPTWVGAWRPLCPNPSARGEVLNATSVYRRFSMIMCRELKEHGIPFALNADEWFFDIEKLSWRRDTAQLLDLIFECWSSG